MSHSPPLILVEKHYLPEDVYMRVYGSGTGRRPVSAPEPTPSIHVLPSTTTTTSHTRTGDVLTTFMSAFFNAGVGGSAAATSRGVNRIDLELNSALRRYDINTVMDVSSCAICTVDWGVGDEIRILSRCRHKFHKGCIDTWLREHETCPMCRTAVVQPDVNEVD